MYFVVYRWKEEFRHLGQPSREWTSYPNEAQARIGFARLKGKVLYRCLSYGLGNILEERGRP